MNKFYAYRQNDSFGSGSFDHDASDGIGVNVWIEAESAEAANKRAQDIGLYFDGCSSGIDCHSCGDRWYEADESDASESPEKYSEKWRAVVGDEEPTMEWGLPSYIHFVDGSFKAAIKE